METRSNINFKCNNSTGPTKPIKGILKKTSYSAEPTNVPKSRKTTPKNSVKKSRKIKPSSRPSNRNSSKSDSIDTVLLSSEDILKISNNDANDEDNQSVSHSEEGFISNEIPQNHMALSNESLKIEADSEEDKNTALEKEYNPRIKQSQESTSELLTNKNIPKSSLYTPIKNSMFLNNNLWNKKSSNTSNIMVYKSGSQSTPRKTRKNQLQCHIYKNIWGTPEMNNCLCGRRSLLSNKNKNMVIGNISNRKNNESSPTLLVKPFKAKQFTTKKSNGNTSMPGYKPCGIIKGTPKKNSTEVFKITPVKTLVKRFEQFTDDEKLNTVKERKVTVKISHWSPKK